MTHAYINRKTREKEKKRKEGARDGGIGRRGREKEKEWRGKEKKEQKKGKGGRSSGKGREEGNGRTERGEIGKREGRTHTRKHKDTQMNTDEYRCTKMHTDRKKNIQTSTKIGRERNGERERRG